MLSKEKCKLKYYFLNIPSSTCAEFQIKRSSTIFVCYWLFNEVFLPWATYLMFLCKFDSYTNLDLKRYSILVELLKHHTILHSQLSMIDVKLVWISWYNVWNSYRIVRDVSQFDNWFYLIHLVHQASSSLIVVLVCILCSSYWWVVAK